MKTAIIIPTFNPDERLKDLVQKLQRISDSAIVVVDDGSAPSCRPLFTSLEKTCVLARHDINLGKGAALKTGIRLAMRNFPELSGVVTADADGQHLPEDIVRLSDALSCLPDSLILGGRDFSSAGVPAKSRWGNRVTSLVFYFGTGIKCPDTQTGLRAVPASLFDFCLSVPGDRFEYEMNVLAEAAKNGVPIETVPVSTVYLNGNRATHFRPILDSLRIYLNLLRFTAASLICGLVDLSVFTLLAYLLGKSPEGLFISTVAARCLSGTLNFVLNRIWAFKSRGRLLRQSAGYVALYLSMMFLSWALVTLLSGLSVNITLVKFIVDNALFFPSYLVQRKLIFKETSCGA